MIKKMDDILIKRIAAGEIIENPTSIVKELIENSIDAKSTKINISFVDGGKQYICVSDDGIGIETNELELAIEKHATSKLNSLNDLNAIKTLGFRGEALSSISSISNLRINSSTGKNSTLGGYIETKEGEIIKKKTISRVRGTTVEIENLFNNIPARKKFLATSKTESRKIYDLVLKFSFIYPNISFLLKRDNRVIFQSYGIKNTEYALRKEFGLKTNPIYNISYQNENGVRIKGFISDGCKKTSRNQVVSINKRIIKNKELLRVIEDSYRNFIPHGNFPILVLDVGVDFKNVDPNSHPRKEEVRILDMEEVYSSINEAIQQTFFNYDIKDFEDNFISSERKLSWFNELKEDMDCFDRIKIIGQFKKTFILTEINDELVIFDQHAGHERVNYEKIKNSYESNVEAEPLNNSIILSLSKNQFEEVENNRELLFKMGLEYDIFGNNEIIIRTKPKGSFLSKNSIQLIFEEIGHSKQSGKIILNDIALRACKTSIKGNEELSENDMYDLIKEIFKIGSVSCPHGRPIFLSFSLSNLNKQFKREF